MVQSLNLYTKFAGKMAYNNSVDPDQTDPEGAAWSESLLSR